MPNSELMVEGWKSDRRDPTGSWDAYLQKRQGSVGLSFPEHDFESSALARKLGELQVVEFASGPIEYQRTRRHVARDGEGSQRVLVPISGDFRFEQDGQRELFYPGKVGLFRWDHQLFMTHEEPVEAVILTVPEGTIQEDLVASAPLALDGRRPLVQSLAAQIRLLGGREPWTATDYQVAYTGVLNALKGILNPYANAALVGSSAVIAEKAHRVIVAHSRNPKLNPAIIAAMLNIGERTLYAALRNSNYPPVGRMIREVRVDRVHARVIGDAVFDLNRVAHEEGFASVASLREAYRQRHNRTPTRMRDELYGDRDTTVEAELRAAQPYPMA